MDTTYEKIIVYSIEGIRHTMWIVDENPKFETWN